MKIEAGMKLTVRKDLTKGYCGKTYVTDEMAAMSGETVEVSRVCESGKIELKGIEFYWTASMFEEFTEWIKEVLNNHLKWLKNDPAGRRADLRNADLRGADLHGAEIKDREGNEVKIEKIMSIGPIGSRNNITIIYFTIDNKALVRCGFFYDYLDKFETAVHKTHAGNRYEKQYMALIELAKTMMEKEHD